MNRCLSALALCVGLALPLCAQDFSEAESWPPLEDDPHPDRYSQELDEELDRELDDSLERALRRPRRIVEPNPEPEPFMDFDHEGVIRLEAFYIPVFGLKADKDRKERDDGIEFEADAKTGEGLMARFAAGDVASIGLLAHVSRHRERDRDTWLDAYGLYIDGQVGGALNEGPLEVVLYVGLGLGVIGFDYEDHFDDQMAAAMNLRFQAGVRVFEHLEVMGTAGWIHWGWPGESAGNGGWLGLGVALRF